jgi:cell division protein FtsI/penicillin-binding protein 2
MARIRSRHSMQGADPKRRHEDGNGRIRVASVALLGIVAVIIVRLFFLMVIQHGFYEALAAGSHTLYEQLFPERGSVYIQDSRTKEEFPIALNKDLFTVFVDTRVLTNEDDADLVATAFAEVFGYDDEKKLDVYTRINGTNDPYEPVEKDVEESIVDVLKEKKLPGVGYVRHASRFYPEGVLASQTIGFVGKDTDGKDVGRYGIEGYWNDELAGSGGFLEASKSLAGSVIPFASKSLKPSVDGSDLLLTIDRTLQYTACERLRQGFVEYGATSASLIIMEPQTGAIRAMCSLPDFDPNAYGKIDDVRSYNNTGIFTPYEPGSIFKPLTMVAAVNEGKVTPDTYFYDTGSVDGGCTKPIQNALLKSYKDQTMTGVLENSINTGMVYVVNQLGKHSFISYLESFGFGVKTGLPLDSEISGTINTLREKKGEAVDCYTSTASFGQGITATPLQMLTAFNAIANKGKIMRPYIVEEVRQSDGKIVRTAPQVTKEIVSAHASSLVSAMMVRVIDTGQAHGATVPGYYVAGKTGTAQIAGPGGYSEDTNHSFVGFAPADDPAFLMIVKFEKPQRRFADSTTIPVFADVAKFVLDYYHVPPER